MASPPIRQFLTAKDGTGSLSVTTGSGTLSTDLLVMVHYDDFGVLADMGTPSSGTWTLQASSGSAPHGAIKAWTKPAVGGAETVTVAQTGNGRIIAVWVLEGAVIDGAAASGAAYSSTQTASSVSPTGATDLLLQVWGSISFTTGTSYTVPSGYTSDLNTNFDSATGYILAAHKSLTSSGATGTQAATGPVSSGDSYNTVTMAFNNAGPPTVTGSAPLNLSATGTIIAVLTGSAALNLSASGQIDPIIAGSAPLNLSAMGQIDPILTGEAPLNLDASGTIIAGGMLDRPDAPGVKLAEQPIPQYRLCIAETTTGQILTDIPFTQVPSWSREILATGSLGNITVPLWPALDSDTLGYLQDDWRYSIVLAYGNAILQAGILSGVSVDDSQQPPVLTINTTTLWDFFTKKRLLEYPGKQITDPTADIVFSATSPDPANQNLSWGSVARRLVEISITLDPKMALPIILPDPAVGTATITYAAADVAYVGQRLTDIIGQANPPEIEFVPVWNDWSQTYFSWEMRISDTRLGQMGYPWVWDYQKACQYLQITRDGSAMTFYSFVKGQDNRSTTGGVLNWSFTNITAAKADEGWPFLWTADTAHSSETDPNILRSYANGDVLTNQNPVYTGTATIRIDGHSINGQQTGSPPVDQLSTGDTIYIQVAGHPFLASGKYGARILAIGSGQDLWTAVLTLQILGVS